MAVDMVWRPAFFLDFKPTKMLIGNFYNLFSKSFSSALKKIYSGKVNVRGWANIKQSFFVIVDISCINK